MDSFENWLWKPRKKEEEVLLQLLVIGLIVIGYSSAYPSGRLLQESSFRPQSQPIINSIIGRFEDKTMIPRDDDPKINEITEVNSNSKILFEREIEESLTTGESHDGFLSAGSYIDNGFVVRFPHITPEIDSSNVPAYYSSKLPMKIHDGGPMGPLSILEEFNHGFIN